MHTVKWFQVLLCYTNNSNQYQLFVCTQFYLTHKWDPIRVLPLWVRVDLGVMAVEEYFIFSRTWNSLSDSFVWYPGHPLGRWGFLPLCRDAVDIFYSPRWLGHWPFIQITRVDCSHSAVHAVGVSFINYFFAFRQNDKRYPKKAGE